MVKYSGKILLAIFIMIIVLASIVDSMTSGGQCEDITIQGDGSKIIGTVYIPSPTPKGYIVLSHGNRREGRKHPLYRDLAKRLSSDYVVLTYDFTGYGESEKPRGNRFETLDFSKDIIASVRYLNSRFDIPPEDVILIGHSLGSLQVLNAGGLLNSRIIIPIGAGDIDRIWLSSQGRRKSYVDKIKKETDVEIESESLVNAFDALRFERIFSRYQFQNIIFIFGEYERNKRENTEEHINGLYRKEGSSINATIVVIPDADHMFRTEKMTYKEIMVDTIKFNPMIKDLVRTIKEEINKVKKVKKENNKNIVD